MGRRRRPGKSSRRAARGAAGEEESDARQPSSSPSAPCSFVVKRGRLTPAARLLVQDLRMLMSPYCSSRLREKRSNKLKDFVAVSSLLGVTHLQAVSQTEAGVYLKVAQLPSGPTLTFQVSKFSLMKDVRKAAGLKARNDSRDFRSPALLLFSGGSAGDKRNGGDKCDPGNARAALQAQDVEQLVTKMMKNVFPAIDVQTVPLSECRRVALYRRQHTPASGSSKTRFTYLFRQYAIVRRAAGVTSGVRRLVEAASRPAVERKIFRSLGLREATPQRESEREAHARACLQSGEALRDASEASDEERQSRLKRRDVDICDITLHRERRGSCFSDSEAEEEETVVAFDSRTAKATCPAPARTNQPQGGLNALLSSCADGELREAKKKREREDEEDGDEDEDAGHRDEMWRMAIALVELGPRMELQLVKIEEDVCAGRVLYHHFISKTPEELRMLKAKEAAVKAERQRQREEMERAVELQMKKKRRDREDDSDGSSAASGSGDEQVSGTKGVKKEGTNGKARAAASSGDEGGSGDESGEEGRKERQRRTKGVDASDSDGDSDTDDDADASADDEAEDNEEAGPGRQRKRFHPFSFKSKRKKTVDPPAESSSVIETVSARGHQSHKRGSAKMGKDEKKQGKPHAGTAGRGGKKKLSSADMVLQKYKKAKQQSGNASGKT
ncbi:brix domain-containing protein [Toxoplasma gondii ME49]|uniref:Brix domain-containing protein n=1 Tax=Toxoplasma gondii (strain ATCC 50611 / Me49) TaxID=508771 RepID=S8GA78_TOXGM|nr:brix domain-containing protein [Toxoplasma gondii ME49]EPT28690.1 brix domain-containing protein [Toxoplasma gondii ME49]|eukprot:XP_002365985.1 brix domain-containing protein [Toxoplasma gondii ME49]